MIAVVTLACHMVSAQQPSATATVVFYTHGRLLTSGVPGTTSGIFWGKLYEDKEQLLNFRERYPFNKKNLIVALAFKPGPHTFAAGYPTMPTSHGALALNLEQGKTYFVRAESKSEGIGIVEVEKGQLVQVPCETARKETQQATSLSEKKLAPDRRGSIVPLTLPVSCP